LRRAARASGEAGLANLWAGQAYELAEERPAAEVVKQLSRQARIALEDALRRLRAD
jgi:nitronate monooxygenase